MIQVECYSGHKVNERPISFTLMGNPYKVQEIIDSWYGETCVYFKVKANDDNIYLLKYDERQDQWDLVFYQNPKKLNILLPSGSEVKPVFQSLYETKNNKSAGPLH